MANANLALASCLSNHNLPWQASQREGIDEKSSSKAQSLSHLPGCQGQKVVSGDQHTSLKQRPNSTAHILQVRRKKGAVRRTNPQAIAPAFMFVWHYVCCTAIHTFRPANMPKSSNTGPQNWFSGHCYGRPFAQGPPSALTVSDDPTPPPRWWINPSSPKSLVAQTRHRCATIQKKHLVETATTPLRYLQVTKSHRHPTDGPWDRHASRWGSPLGKADCMDSGNKKVSGILHRRPAGSRQCGRDADRGNGVQRGG